MYQISSTKPTIVPLIWSLTLIIADEATTYESENSDLLSDDIVPYHQ